MQRDRKNWFVIGCGYLAEELSERNSEGIGGLVRSRGTFWWYVASVWPVFFVVKKLLVGDIRLTPHISSK